MAWSTSAVAQSQPPSASTPWDGTWLGNLGGVRAALDQYGVSFGLQSVNEVFGNPNGGRARGVDFDGENTLSLGVDLEKAVGLKGGIFNVSALQNYGHGPSANNIDNMNLVSSIEARRSAWLFELWYQQSFFDGAADVRLGQLAADQEFMITQYGNWFINEAFSWPTLPSVNLPAGGPAAPLATPGLRVRVSPSEQFTTLLGVFNGDPAGPGLGNPQLRDSSGTLFRVGDGVFSIAEAQYRINGGKDPQGPPITLKIGGWYHSKATPNQFFANNGLTVVSPVSAGSSIARENFSAYAVADAMLLPGPGGKGGLAAFARVAGSPPGRSQISIELTGGLVYNGPFGRDSDMVGLGVSSVRVGRALGSIGALASQYAFHGHETVLELSYQAQVRPWLQVRPDFQYIITPGGGIADPTQPGQQVGSAAVFGLRTTAAF
ncbi:MAG TPA: carbohydrate porin [Rhodopila sp.]